MSRLQQLPVALQRSLEQRSTLKVIAGLMNFDPASVGRVARAAGHGGADLIDVACDPALVALAIEASGGVPICVSSVEPELFPAAVAAGAAMVEIGNFDAFYPEGRIFGAAEVIELTRRTRSLLPEVVLSVTVPHVLPMDQQEQLAIDLVAAGADLIQTEGGTSAKPFSAGSLGLIEKAAPTLAAAHSISRVSTVPVLCASGLSAITVPMAIAAGAAGGGVGSAVNRLNDELAMVAVVRELHGADWLAVAVAGSGFGAPPGGGDAVGGGVFRLFNCPRFCSADWFVGDAADCSVKAFVGVALGCGQPGRIAGSGELAIQLADHGDPVQPGGGVN